MREDPLAIGGVLYLRSVVAAREGSRTSDWQLSLPVLVDGYLDARPNDRVRGFVLTRVLYDGAGSTGAMAGLGSGSGTTGDRAQPTPAPGSVLSGTAPANPRVLLDQLWVHFDIGHRVFVTAGKQHVKWGTAHFWTPEDFFHSVARDPLSVFDERTGTTMLKLHIPWEQYGWNVYGVAAFDLDNRARTIEEVAGAARAEVVFGSVELGADVLARHGQRARFGADLSAGIGPFDIYIESALTSAQRWRWRQGTGACPYPILDGCERKRDPYFAPQVAAGATWSHKYSDEDAFTLGVEGFYNGIGDDGSAIYPTALLAGELVPFYAGRRYAGVYVLIPSPGSWNDTTFIVSTLGNLSDKSYVSRLAYQVLVLTYLHVEAFGAVHYGRKGGEFRFTVDLPPLDLGSGVLSPPTSLRAPVFEAGLAVHVTL